LREPGFHAERSRAARSREDGRWGAGEGAGGERVATRKMSDPLTRHVRKELWIALSITPKGVGSGGMRRDGRREEAESGSSPPRKEFGVHQGIRRRYPPSPRLRRTGSYGGQAKTPRGQGGKTERGVAPVRQGRLTCTERVMDSTIHKLERCWVASGRNVRVAHPRPTNE